MTRTVVVTGAGQGLGAAIARAVHHAGWIVGVLDRDASAAALVADELGERAVALTADTTAEHEVDAALDRFADATGLPAPHGLVANAGVVRFGPLATVAIEDWRTVVDVNLTGTFITARAAARRMIDAATGGSLVMVTSMNGVVPGPNAGAYGATKAGVALLTQQMAVEWGPAGIRANAVAPGLIDGGMSAPIYADPAIREQRAARVPLGRLGATEDVADAVLFLLSDHAGYISGTELLVDGGVTPSIISTLPRPRAVDTVGPTEDA
jgi:NAD(P)-dependent dehydrogenase (short-subunit alcohol dehydrogenase family)